MIPEFPNFKKLEYSDKADVQAITKKYTPHSDFNFTGLWTWDVHDEKQISILNGNLVMKSTDYLTGEPFYSYLGDKKVSETVDILLTMSEKEAIKPELKLVPEDFLETLDKGRFNAEEDRDHFDYVLDNEKLVGYVDKELRNHAGLKNKFIEVHGDYATAKILNLSNEKEQKDILKLGEQWAENKKLSNKDLSSETSENIALKKIFEASKDDPALLLVGVFHKDRMIAYVIDESVKTDYLICHFMKADSAFKGIYSYLISEAARLLLARGKRYVNLEQDLGLKNLRQSKKSFAPVFYQKKYIITRKLA